MAIDTSGLTEVAAPSDTDLQTVSNLAKLQVELEGKATQLEAQLKAVNANLRKVSEDELPEAMRAVGLREIKLDDGSVIKLTRKVHASISAANLGEAIRWLTANGHAGLVRNEVKVAFGPGEDATAAELKTYLDSQLGHDYDAKPSVHPQTLKAWAREQLDKGLEIPEAISVYDQTVSKITK